MNCREAALQYISRGWSVIPVTPGSKKPLVNWIEFRTRVASVDEINGWYSRWPDAGVGLVLGPVSGLVVLDIDPRNGGDPIEWAKRGPTGLMSKTGGGGAHLFYRCPTARLSTTSGAPGVDIKGPGGFVVLPPTVHSSGNKYEWVDESEPADCPVFMLERSHTPGQLAPTKKNWVEVMDAGHGGRNTALASLAGLLAQKRVPESVALGLLNVWAHQRNDDGELGPDVVRAMWERMLKKEPVEDSSWRDSPPLDFLSLCRVEDIKLDWIVEGWIPVGCMTQIAALPAGFKTWMALDLAMSVASGRDFLGEFKVERPGPVLIVNLDDRESTLRSRLRRIYGAKFGRSLVMDEDWAASPNAPDIPLLVQRWPELSIMKDEDLEWIEETIHRYGLRLIVVDTLGMALDDAGDYMASAKDAIRSLKQIRNRTNCGFIFTHHTKKNVTDEGLMTDSYGSVMALGAFEERWTISRTKDTNSIKIWRRSKDLESDNLPLIIDFKINGEIDYEVTVSEAEIQLPEESTDDRDKMILDAIKNGTTTAAGLERVTGLSRSSIRRRLENLERDRKIQNMADPKSMEKRWVIFSTQQDMIDGGNTK